MKSSSFFNFTNEAKTLVFPDRFEMNRKRKLTFARKDCSCFLFDGAVLRNGFGFILVDHNPLFYGQ